MIRLHLPILLILCLACYLNCSINDSIDKNDQQMSSTLIESALDLKWCTLSQWDSGRTCRWWARGKHKKHAEKYYCKKKWYAKAFGGGKCSKLMENDVDLVSTLEEEEGYNGSTLLFAFGIGVSIGGLAYYLNKKRNSYQEMENLHLVELSKP